MNILQYRLSPTIFYYLPLVGLCLFYTFRAYTYIPHDFANYYFGAHFLTEGLLSEKLYEPYYFNQLITDLGYQNIFVSYSPNPPFTAVFFLPFTFLGLWNAKLLFNIISIGLFIYAIRRAFEKWQIPKIYLLLIPFIGLTPIRNNLLFGQVYLLLFFFLVEGFIALKAQNIIKLSTFWSIAILLKVFPAILFFLLFIRKQYKAAFSLAGVSVILLGLSLIWVDWEVWWYYITHVLSKANQGEINVSFSTNFQSAFMLLKYLFIASQQENIPLLDAPFVFVCILFVFKAGILLGCLYLGSAESELLKANKHKYLITFSIWMLGSLLLTPYGSSYSLILLLIPLLALLANRENITYFHLQLLLLFIIANLPVSLFRALPIPLQFPRLYLTLGLLCMIFPWRKLSFPWKELGVAIALNLPTLTLLNKFSPSNSKDVLLINNHYLHSLIIDYGDKHGLLSYQYWSENGVQEHVTTIEVASLSDEQLSLQDNQIIYKNKPITQSKDRKIKPLLLNQNQIIYLSDKGRGIGFYTLRKIDITKEE